MNTNRSQTKCIDPFKTLNLLQMPKNNDPISCTSETTECINSLIDD